ncbi:zinc-ribbon domain-containing protein [Paracoccus angustae]|uniref:zinc-ribbon domain-containing protein n=1 Tax=Paracoccus angustae TaxID=1671480 RepID=UPI00366BB5CA
MAEIRLICPGCAAEYRLPETAIPPEGREVECSACGNVWYATARPAGQPPASAAPGDEPPRLSRRLPDTVLDILRDEVEHERRARAAEGGAPLPPAPPPAPPRAADPEWPATTVTTAITPHVDADAGLIRHPAPLPRPQGAPVRSQAAPAQPVQPIQPVGAQPAKPLPRAESPLPEKPAAASEQPAPPAPAPAPVSRPARGGYAAGFGLAALLAAACVALYLLAPALSGQGALGEGLMQLRGQADEARLWLQNRVAGPIR